MDFHLSDPGLETLEEAVDDAGFAGLPRAASEALTDPIVQALMAADGLNPRDVEAFLRHAAARLAGWKATAAQRNR